MKKVLVTGASGFIGRACIDLLVKENQYEVHAISTKNNNGRHSNVYWHKANLHDHISTQKLLGQIGPSHLLHLAWYATPGKFWSSDENYKWVVTSYNLLHSFASTGGKRCVVAGSCAEYSWDYGACLENKTPLEPASVYGKCKNSLHIMQNSFCRDVGISCAWGRVFHLYGPHEPEQKLVSSVILSLLKRMPAKCSHGEQIRDYLFVNDVASAFITLMDSKIEGAVNIASGKPLALKYLLAKIADKLDGHDLIQFGALPPAVNEPETLSGDTNRLVKEVGWHQKYNLDEGLDLTIEWWRQQLKLTD